MATKAELADKYWHELGLAAPARRALISHKIYILADLKKFSKAEVAEFHGFGPSGFVILERELKKLKLTFKK